MKYLFSYINAPILVLLFPLFVSAQDIPVVVNQTSNANVMLVLDDSGSMNAVMEHGDFDADSAAATNTSNTLPSVFFRLESGVNAPANSQTLTPVMFEMNWGLWNRSGGSVYTGKSLSSSSSANLISAATCNNSNGSTVSCPGSSRGINVFKLYGNGSVTGSSVFSTSNLAESGGTDVTDSNGNEWLLADYRRNDYATQGRNWHGIWPKFNGAGNAVTVNTRPYVTLGGNIVFNGKEVFLSAGWYREEYLRWIFYTATAAQLASLPGKTRIETIKDVVTDLINNNPSVGFGITTLNGSTYSAGVHSGSYGYQMWTPEGNASQGQQPRVRATIGTSTASLITTVQGLTAYGGTPLATTYIEALKYFAGERERDPYRSGGRYTSPISSECDASFVVLLTDGLPSSDTDNHIHGHWIYDYDGDNEDGANRNRRCSSSRCSNFLDDAAHYAYNNDFSSSVDGIQNIRSYAVGLGLDFDLLDDFAANGGSGQALRADTSQELTDALSNIVSNLVTTAVGAAGVAVAEVFGENGQVFRPRFNAANWSGNVEKFYASGGSLVSAFDMGDLLEARDLGTNPRTIYSGSDPDGDGRSTTMIDFTTANAATLRPQLFKLYDSGTLNANLLADPIDNYTQNTAAETLISFIHGTDAEDMRTRDSDGDGNTEKLGDIVYSRPKYVGPSNAHYSSFNGYTSYVRSRRSEQNLLLVGANDGMLHAFDADTGQELWAYIPSSLLPYLEMLARPSYNNEYHRYYINGQIKVEDVYVGGSWKTLAMFGLGGGGSQWIVLDITDRDTPQLLFEVNDPSAGGESWNEPVVVVNGGTATSSSPGSYNWYMVVGTGEDKATNGTNLLVYDLNGGAVAATTVSIASGHAAGTRSTSMAAVQSDTDLSVDRGYVGTETGDLYRVNLTGAPGSWSVQKLYNGSSSQPITARPTAVLSDNPIYSGGGSGPASFEYAVGVYFGTGRYDTSSDVSTVGATSQNIIGIFDPTDIDGDTYAGVHTNLTKSDLENQSVGTFDVRHDSDKIYRVPSGDKGFYMNLATSITVTDNFIEPVGMVTHPPTNVRGIVLFSTFLPNSDPCSVGGFGFIQAVNFRTGGGSLVDSISVDGSSFYNGGIPDIDADGDRDSDDLDTGYPEGNIGAVLDTYVESIDLSSTTPYEHDGNLEKDDISLHATNGGCKPQVSSLGENGVPGPPAVLFQDGQIIIQSAYIVTVNSETGDEDDEEATIDICYSESGSLDDRQTLTIGESQLATYIGLGAEVGACPESDDDDDSNKMTICHYPPGNPANMHTITISNNAWPAHQAHGDTEGACDDDGGDDGGSGGTTEELADPNQVPINIYNLPPSVLGYHESIGD